MGSKRCSDSAMEQFVFFCVKDSVAAVKMESSWMGAWASRLAFMASAPEEAEGMALGSEEEVFRAGPLSVPGDGGGVGYASWPSCDLDCHMERKLSKPLTFGRSHWYVMGCGDWGVRERTCSSISAELAICLGGQRMSSVSTAVAHLWYPFGRDEGACLNGGQTSLGQPLNQLYLGRQRYRLLLILQPIARPNFHNANVVCAARGG